MLLVFPLVKESYYCNNNEVRFQDNSLVGTLYNVKPATSGSREVNVTEMDSQKGNYVNISHLK